PVSLPLCQREGVVGRLPPSTQVVDVNILVSMKEGQSATGYRTLSPTTAQRALAHNARSRPFATRFPGPARAGASEDTTMRPRPRPLRPLALVAPGVPCRGGGERGLPVRAAVKAEAAVPQFRTQEIEKGLGVGYAVLLVDVNGDGKKDIVVVDTRRVVWYENPTWKRRTIIEGLTKPDNVCIAAHDIDGDGQIDFALGAGWKGLNSKTD